MTKNTKRELPDDIMVAEGMSRSDEGKVEILRSLAAQNGAYQSDLDRAMANAKESSDHVAKLRGEVADEPEDLSGVSRGLSDSEGNFAPNLDVLKAGGIGVEASNSVAGTDQQATSADQVETEAEAAERLAGENASQAGSQSQSIEIPAGWQDSHWRTRVALAERISGRDDVKGEEANAIIEAEEKRRAAE